MAVRAPAPRLTVASVLHTAELGGLLLGVVLIGLLHVVAPTNLIDPWRVTISEYGRSSFASVFVSAVVLIAIGSAATLVILVRQGTCRTLSVPSLGLALWIVGMIGVATFQKADWAAGATWVGHMHRGASMLAFVALPIAILVLAARERRQRPRIAGEARFGHLPLTIALGLALATLAAMAALGVFIAVAEARAVPWWTLFPIGLTERLLVGVELTALALVVAALRMSRR